MATIALSPDNVKGASLWWMTWVERSETIGTIVHIGDGTYRIELQAAYCNPMKSFSALLFDSKEAAADEVCCYLRGR